MGRPRVYITVRRGHNVMVRVLDLAFLGRMPVAVLTWVSKDGAVRIGKHIALDLKLLRKSAPLASFQYDGVAIDPLDSGTEPESSSLQR
jgi:hypothetical protein